MTSPRAPRALIGSLLLLVAGGFGAPGAAFAQVQILEPGGLDIGPVVESPCGRDDFSIASMAWPSAAILAEIHAQILTDAFGCTVSVVQGEPSAALSSITTTGQPALVPEIWASRIAEIWNGAIRAEAVRAAGDAFGEGALEAWFVPDYVSADVPELVSVAALAADPGALARSAMPGLVPVEEAEGAPEGGETETEAEAVEGEASGRPFFISCPADWACSVINRGMLEAYGLAERFEVMVPEDRFALDRMISDAVSRREPFVTYYWQPNALIDRLGLVPLDMGAFDGAAAQCIAIADCVAFGPSAFAKDDVFVAAPQWVFAEAPEVAGYLSRAQMPLAEMNALLAWQVENEASARETAARFIATRETLWRDWIGLAAQ
ncbi:glycine betaine ABC transporter substrate-binding protein [Pelagibacterium montanilacus]|uniref:glycine betaine ABC transporter substrate-binding protein n=1 Tax=Pelagibacterium montanilacus TaxID=2185280 RepID=UPI0013DEB8D8|nr:glycine betaine ABC transporter substrate-binding protein [Pelagibacterium montanilacus]